MPKNVVIYSDDDLDGLMSTRLTYNHLIASDPNVNIKLLWQKWADFGLSEESSKEILDFKPDEVFILDVGSDEDTIKSIKPILEQNIPVTLLDNHPPDLEVIGADAYNDFSSYLQSLKDAFSLEYVSTTTNCTTGIVYRLFEKTLETNPINKLWAIMGLKGDVATDKVFNPDGYAIYEKCIKEFPQLNRGFFYGTFTWNNLDFMNNFFHNPRRLLYDDAPQLCFDATTEIQDNPDKFRVGWLNIYKTAEQFILGKKTALEAFNDYPNVKRVMEVYAQWKGWKDVEKRGHIITFDYGKFGVSLISHPWNLGSALCATKSNDMKKSQFVINDIPGKLIHVSGRGYRGSPIHIGKILHNCNPGILRGGGLKQAGGAQAIVNDVEAVLEELTNTGMRLYP